MAPASPDTGQLRSFGLITGGIFVGLFGLLLPWLFDRPWPLWPWYVGTALALWALAAPETLALVYKGWMAVGHVLGRINTTIILLIVFIGVVLPTGAFKRLFGKDSMARERDATTDTYRVTSPPRSAREHMKRPF